MKDSIKNRKNLLALCLSLVMLSSAAAAFAACKDGNTGDSSSSSSSSSESTSEVKDDGLIKNAGFETFDDEKAITTSVTGWTRSTNSTSSGSALSSKAASGILDLSAEGKKNLVGSYYADPDKVLTLTEAQAKADWDKLTVRDKLTYYEQWEKNNKNGDIDKDLSFYESINIDLEDIPEKALIDALTPHTGAEEGDDRVLMLHNQNPEKTENGKTIGTAQKYTSSSTVTVKAGTSAKFSVWVRTYDLTCSDSNNGSQPAVGKGAYISVTHSVGGTSLDEYRVENIQTDEWTKYEFYLKGSSYTDTTFSLVLGLGQGGGTYRGDYVNGYAFFDGIQCDVITNEAFNTACGEDGTNADGMADFNTAQEDKVVDVSLLANADKDLFALNFYGNASTSADTGDFFDGAAAPTPTETNGVTSDKHDNPASWLEQNGVLGFESANDVVKVLPNGVKNQAELADLNTKYFSKDTTFETEKTLLLWSKDGVAYTAKSNEVGFGSTNYLALSFFVKTSDLKGHTGASITLVDGNNKTSFDSIDTTDMEKVVLNKGTDEETKLYGDWVEYFFFVENESEDPTTKFHLEFNFGPKTIDIDTTTSAFRSGFAAFTGFRMYEISEKEFESAQGGAQAKLVSVMGDKEESDEDAGNAFATPMGTPSDAIKKGLANPQTYKGVYADSAYVTGTGSQTDIHTNKNAGLISKKYFTSADEGYFATASGAWFEGIKGAAPSGMTTASEVWESVFGNDSTQPLFAWNDGSNTTNAYGFLGNFTSVAANTYTAVSVRVKGTANAKAYIRLIDKDQDNFTTALSIGRNLTYWYDDDGNICSGDPAKGSTQIAFKLQKNGLYKANEKWSGYASLTNKDAYYANLNAYAKDETTGDLLVAKNGASHNYSDKWDNEGMDGIAFYAKDGSYYADRDREIKVENLASVSALTPRYEAKDAKNLEATVTLSNENWTTVTFYIHTGNLAKNYRLELWAGYKDGAAIKPNDADTYVIFDYNNPGTAESNFTGLLDQYEDLVADDAKFKGVFSYFDTANYLRYNAELDENKIGNLYEDNYTPSENKEGTAYLEYVKKAKLTVGGTEEYTSKYVSFADYQYSEKAVTASEAEDDTDDDTTEEEPESGANVWLLASSLAIAGVLILAVASIIVRKIVVKSRKNRASQASVKKSKK